MGESFGTEMICPPFLLKARSYRSSSRYDLCNTSACAIPFHHLDQTHLVLNFRWAKISTLIGLCIMLLLLKCFHDPLPEVTRNFDELVSLFECVDSSVTAQVTHQYLRMVCCHTGTVPLNGSLFSAAALFL